MPRKNEHHEVAYYRWLRRKCTSLDAFLTEGRLVKEKHRTPGTTTMKRSKKMLLLCAWFWEFIGAEMPKSLIDEIIARKLDLPSLREKGERNRLGIA